METWKLKLRGMETSFYPPNNIQSNFQKCKKVPANFMPINSQKSIKFSIFAMLNFIVKILNVAWCVKSAFVMFLTGIAAPK